MTNTIKNEFNNFKIGFDYVFSVEGNKEVYIIYSEKLKQFTREIIVNKVLSERFRKSIKMEGHSIDGGYFSYEGGVDDLPDSFIANAGWEEKMEKRIEEVRKQEEETKQRSREIRERVEKEGCPPENHSFHFSRWEGDNLVEKKSLFLNYDPFEVNDNSSKIQQITNKETKQIKTENSPNSDKKDHQVENKNKQQNQSQKIDNNNKKVFYGIGVIFLVLAVISMLIVWVKKKR